MKRIALLVISLLILNIQPANAADVLPKSFFTYLGSKYLANPGVILIDRTDNSVVYESGADVLRAPASVLKLVSTSAIALTMDSTPYFAPLSMQQINQEHLLFWVMMILGLPQVPKSEMLISGHTCRHC
jgi:hypothetical protein